VSSAQERPPDTRAVRLWSHLTLVQVGVWVLVYAASIAFGRQLLLLDESVVRGSAASARALLAGASVSAAVINALAVAHVRAVFHDDEQDVYPVVRLQRLPLRLALVHVLAVWALSSLFLLPWLRPSTNDLFTQTMQMLLTWTAVAAGALAAYIADRNILARVSERIAPTRMAKASEARMEHEARGSVVRNRLLLAMAVAVGFVAVSASLLVVSYVRAEDVRGRQTAARTAMLLAGADQSAVRRAGELGFVLEKNDSTPEGITHTREGETIIRDGIVRAQFRTALPNNAHTAYVVLTMLAILTALLLGAWIGGFYGHDLALATQEINAMTYDPDIDRKRQEPRFLAVKELLFTIDGLEQVFERFTHVQKRAIGEKEFAERMRALFLASMSHDLKAPLNAILGFAEIAKREALSDSQRESVDIIEQRGRELLELIRTVLDAARLEAGELTMAPRLCAVNELVTEAAKHAIELTRPMGVGVQVQVQDDLASIFVDPERIGQALVAILLCAARSTREGGAITLRAFSPEDGRAVRVDVESPAGRIPRAELESLFVAYRYPEQARKHGSLGLGLSLARSMIEIHGGSLDVESDGAGIVFHATLGTREDEASIRNRSMRRLRIE
jgi:signal transduction histidine kinase